MTGWDEGAGRLWGGLGRPQRGTIDQLEDLRRRGVRLIAEDEERLWESKQPSWDPWGDHSIPPGSNPSPKRP